MFEASEALQKMEGMKKIKSMSFHQYSWNSEEETNWISLIGWHHTTSSMYYISSTYFKKAGAGQYTESAPFFVCKKTSFQRE